jgi:hypothetical protein
VVKIRDFHSRGGCAVRSASRAAHKWETAHFAASGSRMAHKRETAHGDSRSRAGRCPGFDAISPASRDQRPMFLDT